MLSQRRPVRSPIASAARERIIQAATRVFADQGYTGATIAEIARASGFSEAALYEYFDGKEDLLFSVSDTWVEQATEELEDHLFGIADAVGQLRKFLWWYLRYIERTTDNARIIFLTLKTHQAFMEAPGYRKVRAFYGIVTRIIAEGQRRGELNPAIEPAVARSLVLGLIEHTVTRWLLKKQAYPLFAHVEPMFEMIRNALTPPASRMQPPGG